MKRVSETLLALCLSSAGALAQPDEPVPAPRVARGPYLQMLSSTGVHIRWRTDRPCDSRVRFGPSPEQLTQEAGADTPRTEHEIQLTGLEPDRRYYYSIGTRSQVLAGGRADYHFRTAPSAASTRPVRVWVAGDTGTGRYGAAAVRDAYLRLQASKETDLWLVLGDIAYPDGTEDEYQVALFDMYATILRHAPVWPALGNHDLRSSRHGVGPYWDLFTLPGGGEAGGVPSGNEASYSFDYGDVHFVSLDSASPQPSDECMADWLRRDLEANRKSWLIAFWHHPPYSAEADDARDRNSGCLMRSQVVPILEEFGADLVLSGHSHSYERSFLLSGHYGSPESLAEQMILDSGDGRPDGDGAYRKTRMGERRWGTVYVVAGSAAEVRPVWRNDPAMYTTIAELGSVVLDIFPDHLDGRFVNARGEVLDYWSLEKSRDTHPPSIVAAQAIDEESVELRFSEELHRSTANERGRYRVEPGTRVLRAELARDGRGVTLGVTPLSEGRSYHVFLSGLQDRAGNVVEPSSPAATFTFSPAHTISFQDGVTPVPTYAGTEDAYISKEDADANFGSARELRLQGEGRSREQLWTMLRWELAGLPKGARILAAELTIEATNASESGYGIYAMARRWREREVTWKQFGENGSERLGAEEAPDRWIQLGTVGALRIGRQRVLLNEDGVALIQGWIDGSTPNYGLLLGSGTGSDSFAFRSREAAARSQRPKLTVTYTPPPGLSKTGRRQQPAAAACGESSFGGLHGTMLIAMCE